MVNGVWKGVYPWVFGRSRQLSLNKFLDPSTPSMKKVDDGEKEKKKESGENTLHIHDSQTKLENFQTKLLYNSLSKKSNFN